ncbi:MAG: nitroreductase family protein [Bacteroidota bacterium]
MNTIDAIYSRRSVRKYKPDVLSPEILDKLIRTSMQAPTAGNQRTWHYLIIENTDLILQLPVVHPYAQMVREAPLIVLICGDINLEKHVGYWDQDCAAATMCMCLAAHEMGIGSCWLGVHPTQDRIEGVKDIFKLPANIIPYSVVVLGYPDEELEVVDRFLPERIHYGKW